MTMVLLEWAAASVFLMLVVLALRAALGRRISARLRYGLWAVVLVRLLVPVQLFTSPLAGTVIESQRIVTKQTQTEREVLDAVGGQDGPQGLMTATPFFTVPPAVPAPPTVPDAPEPPDPPDFARLAPVLGRVWLAGGVVTALVLAGCNLRFWLRLRRTRRLLDEQRAHDVRPYMSLPVYVADGLPSPCLFGVLRPAVYVTPETAADPAALRHVLVHEYVHFRHGDHLWNLLRCAALCLHWWDPLAWVSAALSRRDGELACDEGALKRLGDGERAAYGNTVLALVTAKPTAAGLLTCATTMAGDKKSLKERISRIAKAPKRWLWAALAVVLVTALACACAFGREAEEPTPTEELSADLSLTGDEDGTVRITGTVDGMELPRGAFWYSPDYLFSDSPYGELSLVYPPFTDGMVGWFSAWWTDEEHTAVNLSTEPMAMLSSYWPSGYWEFTVDFSKGEAKVTRMEAIASFPEGMEVQMHPKTIDHEEAIRAGRIAARLLTAAEEYYRDWEEKGGASAPPKETEVLNVSPQTVAEDELLSHFQTDGDLVGVPWEVVTSVGDWVREVYENYPEKLAAVPFPRGDGSVPAFDGWRVNQLSGPWTNTVNGVDVEVWRINYEFHTTEPDKAENFAAGGMYITEDNWLCPTYRNCTYLIYTLDEAGNRYFAGSTMQNSCSPEESEGDTNETERFYEGVAALLDRNHARAELKAALLGETDFTFYDEEGQPAAVDITTAPRTVFGPSEYKEIWGFYVVDLDGDGAEEVVLHVGDVAADMGGYLVLHWAGPGDVRAYSSYWRNFWDLKTDGTFCYDYYTGISGTARASFPAPGYTMEQHSIVEAYYPNIDPDSGGGTFTVNGQSATQEEYDAAVEVQNAKPDAARYEFTEENVRKALG